MHHRAGIKTDEGMPRNQWIVRESGVLLGIVNHHNAVSIDGVGTKGNVPTGFAHIQPATGLEPLPFLVDQGHQDNREIKQIRHQVGIAVKTLVGGGIQQTQVVQLVQSFLLVCGNLGKCKNSVLLRHEVSPCPLEPGRKHR